MQILHYIMHNKQIRCPEFDTKHKKYNTPSYFHKFCYHFLFLFFTKLTKRAGWEKSISVRKHYSKGVR